MKDYYSILKGFLKKQNFETKLKDLEKLKDNKNNVGIIKMYNQYKKGDNLKEQDCGCGCKGAGTCKPNKKMNTTKDLLKKLISEAVEDRINNINKAGDMAAGKAKISQIAKDIIEAKNCAQAIKGMANLRHYTSSPEVVGDLLDDIENTIKTLEKQKADLEKESEPKGKDKPKTKPAKKDEKSKTKPKPKTK
jgi:hypothetical protein